MQDRYLEISTRRGTYGTSIHLCHNQLPNVNADGSVQTFDSIDRIIAS